MVAVGPNMFYTVTLPCTLWFLDKSKAPGHPSPTGRRNEDEGKQNRDRRDTVLFIDARHIYRQVDRAHRDWTPAQISFLANIVRLYRGEAPDFTLGGDEAHAKIQEVFGRPSPSGRGSTGEGDLAIEYRDCPGLCKTTCIHDNPA